MSWVPFYWVAKCLGLGLLFLPDGNVSSFVFEKAVVWGMDHAHDVLNNLVLPNVVEFVVTLPWRLLLVVFPTLPPPTSSGAFPGAAPGRPAGSLAARLQHLKMPASKEKPARSEKERPSPGSAQSSRSKRGRGGKGAVGGGTGASSRLRPEERYGDSPRAERAGTREVEARRRDSRDRQSAAVPSAARGDGRSSPHPKQDPVPVPASPNEDSERGNRSPRRRSIGEIVRSAITGDFKVRVRDHLFDFKTASPSLGLAKASDGRPSPAARASPERPTKAAPTDGNRGGAPSRVTTRSSKTGKTLPGGDAKDGGGSKTPRGKSQVAATPPPASSQPRYPTRRRPAEFSKAAAGGVAGDGGRAGGDAAGKKGEGNPNHGTHLRRRSGSERGMSRSTGGSVSRDREATPRDPVSRNTPTRLASDSASSSVSVSTRSSVGRGTAPAGADSRAARLEEWRRKRAQQVEAQQREKARGSRPSLGATPASQRGSSGPPSETGSSRSVGRPGSAGGSRRFRHVERFRSEVSGASHEPKDAPSPSSKSSVVTLPSPSARSTRSR